MIVVQNHHSSLCDEASFTGVEPRMWSVVTGIRHCVSDGHFNSLMFVPFQCKPQNSLVSLLSELWMDSPGFMPDYLPPSRLTCPLKYLESGILHSKYWNISSYVLANRCERKGDNAKENYISSHCHVWHQINTNNNIFIPEPQAATTNQKRSQSSHLGQSIYVKINRIQ